MTATSLAPAAFQPDISPVADSLAISALVALLPLITVFLTLGVLRWKAHWAGLTSVAVAIVVASLFFGMPLELAVLSATQGAAFGLFPIMWIVFTAILLYQVTVRSGRFEDLRATFHLISDDPRVQAIIIAFCFGGLLEALAGFGAPVAITGVMLMALGFSPLRAAAVVLLANTAPVAFGAVGTPIITAGNLTGIPYQEIGAYVGHQTPILAAFVPLLLVLMADGRRGVRQTWPIAVVVGLTFAIFQWISATWISVELTDIIASLAGLAAAVLFLKVWQPSGREEALETLHTEREREFAMAGGPETSSGSAGAGPVTDYVVSGAELEERARGLTRGRITMALFPYLLVIVVFAIAKLIAPVKEWLSTTDVKIPWPGLSGEVLTIAGTPERGDDVHAVLAQLAGLDAPHLLAHRRFRLRHRPGRMGSRGLGHRAQDALRLPHGRLDARPGLRHEPLGPDDHDRHLDRGDGRPVRLPQPDSRVDRYRRHRVGHQRQRPVRHAPAERRGDRRHRPDAARRRQHLRRSRRQDDQPAEPDHRGNGRGSGRPRVRHPS
jgi:lactate permease